MNDEDGLKRLKDYPLDKWMEAADGCSCCDAGYQVRILHVRDDGNYGSIEVAISHEEDCSLMDQHGSDEETYTDIAGWEYSDINFIIGDREFRTLEARSNIGICLNCNKFIVGTPLILFTMGGELEVDFCFSCAKELGILNAVTSGVRGLW